MLTRFHWCTSVALSLQAQLVVSRPDTTLPSLTHRVLLAESEAKTATPAALPQLHDGLTVAKS